MGEKKEIKTKSVLVFLHKNELKELTVLLVNKATWRTSFCKRQHKCLCLCMSSKPTADCKTLMKRSTGGVHRERERILNGEVKQGSREVTQRDGS